MDRVLSRSGVVSRREAVQQIREGRVRVDGRVVRDPEHWVDSDSASISIDQVPLQAPAKITVMLHKPKGFLTTTSDPQGRRTIYELLPAKYSGLKPVGRLDLDSSGLLLLTNDSDFAERITSPSSHVFKTYLVKASTRLGDEELSQLARGVKLRDGPTRPAEVQRLRNPGGKTVFEITITEGRNRQVRRMVESIGSKVISLTRIAIGSLELGSLAPGECRVLSERELSQATESSRRGD